MMKNYGIGGGILMIIKKKKDTSLMAKKMEFGLGGLKVVQSNLRVTI